MTPPSDASRRPLPVRLGMLVAGLGAALVITVLLAANIGAEPIPLAVILESARSWLLRRPPEVDSNLAYIFWHLRLPRVLLGATVGTAGLMEFLGAGCIPFCTWWSGVRPTVVRIKLAGQHILDGHRRPKTGQPPCGRVDRVCVGQVYLKHQR